VVLIPFSASTPSIISFGRPASLALSQESADPDVAQLQMFIWYSCWPTQYPTHALDVSIPTYKVISDDEAEPRKTPGTETGIIVPPSPAVNLMQNTRLSMIQRITTQVTYIRLNYLAICSRSKTGYPPPVDTRDSCLAAVVWWWLHVVYFWKPSLFSVSPINVSL